MVWSENPQDWENVIKGKNLDIFYMADKEVLLVCLEGFVRCVRYTLLVDEVSKEDLDEWVRGALEHLYEEQIKLYRDSWKRDVKTFLKSDDNVEKYILVQKHRYFRRQRRGDFFGPYYNQFYIAVGIDASDKVKPSYEEVITYLEKHGLG